MPMSRPGHLFKRIARVIAAVQLLAFASAPLLEAASVGPQRASVFAQGANVQGLGSSHDPASCPACQLLRVSARPVEPPSLALFDDAAGSSIDSDVETAPSSAPRHGFRSRAPPSLLA